MDAENRNWIELVKETRQKLGIGLEEAHAVILADPKMRRLIARRINLNSECRKQALRDIREHGEKSRFVVHGDQIRFR